MKGMNRFPGNIASLNDFVDYNGTCADSGIIPVLGKENCLNEFVYLMSYCSTTYGISGQDYYRSF